MSTFTIYLVLILIVSFLLVVVIMVQNPKGGGLSSSFGGGGGQQLGGVQKTTDFLDKSTWALATVLLVLILLSNVTIMDTQAVPESQVIGGDQTENTTQDQRVIGGEENNTAPGGDTAPLPENPPQPDE